MPSKVFVSITEEAQQFLKTCKASSAHAFIDDASIDIDEFYRIAEEHQRAGGESVKIHELLAGAEVVSRCASEEPELTELQRMRIDAQERAYQRMVSGVAPLKGRKKEGVLTDMQGLSWATNFGVQAIAAFIGAFLFGYYFVETFVDQENTTFKIVAGAACSFCTLLLETCLLMVHESKEEMIEKKRKQVEEKERERARKLAAAKREQIGKSNGEAQIHPSSLEPVTTDSTQAGASQEIANNVDNSNCDAPEKGRLEKKCD